MGFFLITWYGRERIFELFPLGAVFQLSSSHFDPNTSVTGKMDHDKHKRDEEVDQGFLLIGGITGPQFTQKGQLYYIGETWS